MDVSSRTVSLLLALCTFVLARYGPNPILFPTGGTVLTAGTNANIIWKNNTAGTVSVILWKGQPGSLNKQDVIAESIPNTGSVLWPVDGTVLKGEDYSIMITVGDRYSANEISFTAFFTIATSVSFPTQTLWTPLSTILAMPTAANSYQNPIQSPNKGTIVTAGSLFEITWTETTGGEVSFELFKGQWGSYKSLGQFAVGVPNTGHHLWNVDPSFLCGSDYILEIWAVNTNVSINNGINWSPYFTIISSAASSTEDIVLASALKSESALIASSSSTPTTKTASQFPSNSLTSSIPRPPSSSSPSSGLGTGDIVVLAVTIPLCFIFVAAGAWLFWRAKRYRTAQRQGTQIQTETSELDCLPSRALPELADSPAMVELDGNPLEWFSTKQHY